MFDINKFKNLNFVEFLFIFIFIVFKFFVFVILSTFFCQLLFQYLALIKTKIFYGKKSPANSKIAPRIEIIYVTYIQTIQTIFVC